MANKNGSKWIRPERRLAIYLRDDFQCQYCGRELKAARKEEVTLDHLKPRCKGGGNGSENLVTACRACNSSRQETKWTDFATGGAIQRIRRTVRRKVNVSLAKAMIDGENNPVEALR